jgi:glycosidase
LSRQDRLHYSGIYLDLVDRPWAVVRGEVKKWLADMGIVGPPDRPAWVGGASIYEVQIGYSVFAGGYRYEPYPTVQDVRADIGRIQELRFDTIQIRPRQPFPSYNVYDYSDISTTYGEETVLRSVVEDCHGRGMRVILDLLMHGVIDREAVEATARAVREGPFAGRLEEDTGDGFTEDLAHDRQSISWSRHILDFERYWTEGSVEHHPLIDGKHSGA